MFALSSIRNDDCQPSLPPSLAVLHLETGQTNETIDFTNTVRPFQTQPQNSADMLCYL